MSTKTTTDPPPIPRMLAPKKLGPVLLGLVFVLGAALPAVSQQVAEHDADDLPRVATILPNPSAPGTAWETTPRSRPAQAPLLAPNPKLSGATCSGITVTPAGLSAHVFADGFENGGLEAWTPASGTLFARAFTDLEVHVHLNGFEGEALLGIDLTSPRGHRYQRLEAPVTAGSSASGVSVSSAIRADGAAPKSAGFRTLPGYPHPVRVRTVDGLEKAGGGQTTTMTWPVAGTHVVSHGLYGAWSVDASLSSGPGETPLVTCPTTQFTLRP